MACIKCIICPLDAAAEAIDSTIYQLKHDPSLAVVPPGYVEKLEQRRAKLLDEVEKIKQLNSYTG